MISIIKAMSYNKNIILNRRIMIRALKDNLIQIRFFLAAIVLIVLALFSYAKADESRNELSQLKTSDSPVVKNVSLTSGNTCEFNIQEKKDDYLFVGCNGFF